MDLPTAGCSRNRVSQVLDKLAWEEVVHLQERNPVGEGHWEFVGG